MAGRQPEQLKVTELKEELRSRGLSTSGLKADLVKRLKEAKQQAEEAAAAGQAAAEEATHPPAEAAAPHAAVEAGNSSGAAPLAEDPLPDTATDCKGISVTAAAEAEEGDAAGVDVPKSVEPRSSSPPPTVSSPAKVEAAHSPSAIQESVQPKSPPRPASQTAASTLPAPASSPKPAAEEQVEAPPQLDVEAPDAVEAVDYTEAEPSPEPEGVPLLKEAETEVAQDRPEKSNEGKNDVATHTAQQQDRGVVEKQGDKSEPKRDSQGQTHEKVPAQANDGVDIDKAPTTSVKRAHPERSVEENGEASLPAKRSRQGDRVEAALNSEGPRAAVVEPSKSEAAPKSAEKGRSTGVTPVTVFPGQKAVNGTSKEVPPSPRPATRSLRINNLVRPFSLPAIKNLLRETGCVESLWLDQIKTHCYVTYKSLEEAAATREALYNQTWPPQGGKKLVANFVPEEDVSNALDQAGHGFKLEGTELVPVKPTIAKPPTPHAAAAPSAPSPRPDPVRAPEPLPAVDKEELPLPTLDDLFQKTQAKPALYWLPLTEEQVAAKASKGKA